MNTSTLREHAYHSIEQFITEIENKDTQIKNLTLKVEELEKQSFDFYESVEQIIKNEYLMGELESFGIDLISAIK